MARSGTFIHQNMYRCQYDCFDCCDGVYDSMSKTQATDLERTQNFAARCTLKLLKRAQQVMFRSHFLATLGSEKGSKFWQLLLTIVAKYGNLYELPLGVLFVMEMNSASRVLKQLKSWEICCISIYCVSALSLHIQSIDSKILASH